MHDYLVERSFDTGMKLILSSAGFYTDEIVNECADLVKKPKKDIRFTVINEAYAVEYGDHNWVLDDLNRIKINFKGYIELVNLLALNIKDIEERIRLSDVIYVVGGHADYLMSVFRQIGFSKLLPSLLEEKVYVGSSAGSMVVGRRVSTEAYLRLYSEANDYDTDEYLGLVDFAIKPHLDNQLLPNNRGKILLETAKSHPGIIYGLRDDAAIIVNNDEHYNVGSKAVKIIDGKLV